MNTGSDFLHWFYFTVARTCSLIFIVLDVLKPLGDKRLIEKELEGFGIRLNKKPPNIHFRTKDKGGVNFQSMVRTVWCIACYVGRSI